MYHDNVLKALYKIPAISPPPIYRTECVLIHSSVPSRNVIYMMNYIYCTVSFSMELQTVPKINLSTYILKTVALIT